MRLLSLAILGLCMVAPVLAQAKDAPGCSKFKWSIARELTAFGAAALPHVASGQSMPGVMEAASVTLEPQESVTFEAPPGRRPKADPAFAAVLTMPPLAAAGTYQVTLSADGWIDVRQDGKDVKSAAFSGQPDCPGVRKSVKFPLRAGPVTVQISGVAVDSLKVEVLPAE